MHGINWVNLVASVAALAGAIAAHIRITNAKARQAGKEADTEGSTGA